MKCKLLVCNSIFVVLLHAASECIEHFDISLDSSCRDEACLVSYTEGFNYFFIISYFLSEQLLSNLIHLSYSLAIVSLHSRLHLADRDGEPWEYGDTSHVKRPSVSRENHQTGIMQKCGWSQFSSQFPI